MLQAQGLVHGLGAQLAPEAPEAAGPVTILAPWDDEPMTAMTYDKWDINGISMGYQWDVDELSLKILRYLRY